MDAPAASRQEIPCRTCPYCSKEFSGKVAINGFGSHKAACSSWRPLKPKTALDKKLNCCCRSTCPSIAALRTHQASCELFQFREEEKAHRQLLHDPESLANEALYLVLDHGKQHAGDQEGQEEEKGGSEHGQGEHWSPGDGPRGRGGVAGRTRCTTANRRADQWVDHRSR